MNNKWLTFAIVIIGLYLLAIGLGALLNTNTIGTNTIAVIPIKGAITMEGSSGLFGGTTGAQSTTLIRFIEEANNNPHIKGILLEINSPGGTVIASKDIAQAVSSSEKPVVAVIREVGASGGYWVASASDYIIADELSITGSIGVIGSYLEFSELFNEYGITYQQFIGGEHKDIGSPFKEPTPEERRILQEKIDTIHEAFIQAVADNRNMSYEAVALAADGQFYLGSEAKELGLIDDFGGMDEGKQKLEALANITNSTIVTYQEQTTIFDILTGVHAQGMYHFGRGFAREVSEISVENQYSIRAQ